MSCACKLSAGKVAMLPERFRPRFLSGLSEAEVSSIVSAARHRNFLANSVVIHQEDPAERVFLLISGHGRQFVLTGDGRKILLQWLSAGQIFGGAAILSSPFQYLACTEMLSDGCALTWERQTMRELVGRYPKLLDNVLSIAVTENIAWSTAAHISLSSEDAQGRVARLLVSLSSAIGETTADGVAMQITNEDLAEGANVTVFTVSRCLNEWQRAGIVKKGRGKILLRKPELLLAG